MKVLIIQLLAHEIDLLIDANVDWSFIPMVQLREILYITERI